MHLVHFSLKINEETFSKIVESIFFHRLYMFYPGFLYCMYIYIYIYIHTHTHTHTHIYIYAEMIDCGDSDSMIRICEKLDKSNS